MARRIQNELIAKEIGERIAEAREAAGLTQAELAEMLGYAVGSVSHYEIGVMAPNAERICMIAQALRVHPGELLPMREEVESAMKAKAVPKPDRPERDAKPPRPAPTTPREIAAHAIGRRIADERNERGWSQQLLADSVGASRSALSLWETGASLPPVTAVVQVAYAMDLSPADLLEGVAP